MGNAGEGGRKTELSSGYSENHYDWDGPQQCRVNRHCYVRSNDTYLKVPIKVPIPTYLKDSIEVMFNKIKPKRIFIYEYIPKSNTILLINENLPYNLTCINIRYKFINCHMYDY